MSRERDFSREHELRNKRVHQIRLEVDREKWERLDTEQKQGMRPHLQNAAKEYFDTADVK